MSSGMSPIIISFIIVNWNAKDYLRRCLASIAANGGQLTHEAIVVDNASSDGSIEMVETEWPAVRLLQTGANLGFAAGNNIGIRASRGRYLFLVNPDVEILSGCVDSLIAFMDSNPEVGIAGPCVYGRNGARQDSCTRFPSLWRSLCRCFGLSTLFRRSALFHGLRSGVDPRKGQRYAEVLYGMFWAVRREALDAVGLLNEEYFMYFEDADWCLRFKRHGWRAAYVPAARVVHYGGASSENCPVAASIHGQRSQVIFWKSHANWMVRNTAIGLLLTHSVLRTLSALCLFIAGARSREHRRKLRQSAVGLEWLLRNCFRGREALLDQTRAARLG
ncbi:MAG: glycosyltransferase family 2 protein [Candidatus Sumerlaeota bacterium]|nr:glycosyltransferase family 2 protein [Candidatus Sumerlaeota bacterium]